MRKATGGKGVDLIVDLVSARVANQNLAATRILGRIVNVGRLGGMKGEFDFDLHALRRIDYIGVTFRTRVAGRSARSSAACAPISGGAVEAGALALLTDRPQTFPLGEIADALGVMRSNAHFGKIVITMS